MQYLGTNIYSCDTFRIQKYLCSPQCIGGVKKFIQLGYTARDKGQGTRDKEQP